MKKNSVSHFREASVEVKSFGTIPDGREVFCYSITNSNAMKASIINYGATITSLKVPASDGETIDVVLGFDTLQDYIDSYNLPSAPYFGAIIGRYSGRIKKGKFTINP